MVPILPIFFIFASQSERLKQIIVPSCFNRKNFKVLICDIFHIKFNVIIDSEKIKYKLLDECKSLVNARLEYQNIVDNITNEKIDKIVNENKDKIILLIDQEVLSNWFIDSSYFKNSNIKILFEDFIDDVNYNKEDFDYILKDINEIKKVKIYE